MSTTTANLNLLKPELTDPADITKMNRNWDSLDEKLHEIDEKLNEIDHDFNTLKNKPFETVIQSTLYDSEVTGTELQWVEDAMPIANIVLNSPIITGESYLFELDDYVYEVVGNSTFNLIGKHEAYVQTNGTSLRIEMLCGSYPVSLKIYKGSITKIESKYVGISKGTFDLTPGVTPLATDSIYLVYE